MEATLRLYAHADIVFGVIDLGENPLSIPQHAELYRRINGADKDTFGTIKVLTIEGAERPNLQFFGVVPSAYNIPRRSFEELLRGALPSSYDIVAEWHTNIRDAELVDGLFIRQVINSL